MPRSCMFFEASCRIFCWDLEFLWNLELGIWSFHCPSFARKNFWLDVPVWVSSKRSWPLVKSSWLVGVSQLPSVVVRLLDESTVILVARLLSSGELSAVPTKRRKIRPPDKLAVSFKGGGGETSRQ